MKRFTASTILLLFSVILLIAGILFFAYTETSVSQANTLVKIAAEQAFLDFDPRETSLTNVAQVIQGEVTLVATENLPTGTQFDRNPNQEKRDGSYKLNILQGNGKVAEAKLFENANTGFVAYEYKCSPECPRIVDFFSSANNIRESGNSVFVRSSYSFIKPGDIITIVRVGDIANHDNLEVILNDYVFIKR